MLYPSIPVCFLVIGAALCAPEQVRPDHETQSPRDNLADSQPTPDKVPYEHNIGKRAYSYVSEYKRLPVYNFGLGKRSSRYSFGLGKRSVDDQLSDSNDIDQDALSDFLDQYDSEDDAGYEVKRARPYSFGLGKRFADSSDEKRAKMYDFGLGKRLPMYNFGLGKRAKSYNFGLGKRLSSKFNFGLGKRVRDMHRFSFGLGKRSDDVSSDNYYDA